MKDTLEEFWNMIPLELKEFGQQFSKVIAQLPNGQPPEETMKSLLVEGGKTFLKLVEACYPILCQA